MKRAVLFPLILVICVFTGLSSRLMGAQIVLDNFSDANSTSLYGKGEIGLTSDLDELPPGFTIIRKKFDHLNDHTTGFGYSLKLEDYIIDLYGGVYINVTGNAIEYPYIDGSVYRDLSFYLKATTSTTDWSIEIKDWDENKVKISLGVIPQDWTKFRFDLVSDTNICHHINITNIKAITFINQMNNSMGNLWIDDIVFDDLQYLADPTSDEGNRVSVSDEKIYPNNQVVRVSIIPAKDSTISIKVRQADGKETYYPSVSPLTCPAGQEWVFEWKGRNSDGAMVKNGIYFVIIRINNGRTEERIVKAIGVFQ